MNSFIKSFKQILSRTHVQKHVINEHYNIVVHSLDEIVLTMRRIDNLTISTPPSTVDSTMSANFMMVQDEFVKSCLLSSQKVSRLSFESKLAVDKKDEKEPKRSDVLLGTSHDTIKHTFKSLSIEKLC